MHLAQLSAIEQPRPEPMQLRRWLHDQFAPTVDELVDSESEPVGSALTDPDPEQVDSELVSSGWLTPEQEGFERLSWDSDSLGSGSASVVAEFESVASLEAHLWFAV